MTVKKTKKSFSSRARWNGVIPALLLVLLIGLFIKNSSLAAFYVRKGLALCAGTVLPSIFPCSVLSAIFIALGGGEVIGALLKRPMRLLFGVSGSGAVVLFLGWFCGFPVGAVAGAALLRRGELSEGELSRLMLFANIPSPAFVISAVGDSMLGDHRTGLILYAILLSVSILIGLVLKFFSKPEKQLEPQKPANSGSRGITEALSSTALSMLGLCANIVFFTVISGLILSFTEGVFTSPAISPLICGFFELSGGCAAAAALGGKLSACLCAFILGWSGLGVHFQIIAACEGIKRLSIYFSVKLLQGILCAVAVFLTF